MSNARNKSLSWGDFSVINEPLIRDFFNYENFKYIQKKYFDELPPNTILKKDLQKYTVIDLKEEESKFNIKIKAIKDQLAITQIDRSFLDIIKA